jgi:hypothetical protein
VASGPDAPADEPGPHRDDAEAARLPVFRRPPDVDPPAQRGTGVGERAQRRQESVAETLDTYSHLWPDSDDRTREAIDSVLGGPVRADPDSGSCELSVDASPLGSAFPQVRGGGADGLACKPGSVPGSLAVPVRRPSIYGCRCRHPPAVYPRTRAGRPRRTRARCPEAPDFLTLLQVGFAEPTRSPGSLVVSCTTVSPLPLRPGGRSGGLLSVALSRGSPRVGVAHHLALWSPDFPRHRTRRCGDAVARPAHPQQRG